MPQFKEFLMFMFQLANVIHTSELERLRFFRWYQRIRFLRVFFFSSIKFILLPYWSKVFFFLVGAYFLWIYLSILFFWWGSSWYLEHTFFSFFFLKLCIVLICVYLGMICSSIIFFPFLLLRICYVPWIHLMPSSDLGGFCHCFCK